MTTEQELGFGVDSQQANLLQTETWLLTPPPWGWRWGEGGFSVYTGEARVQSRPHGLNYWWVLGAYEHSFLVSILMAKRMRG